MWGLRFEDDASAPVAITEVRLSGGTGSVELRPGTGARVDIHRTVHYFAPFRRRPGVTHRIDGTVLYLDTTAGTSFPFYVAVDYVVGVPAGTRVSGRLSSGRLRLTGVGPVDVKTSSGSITLTAVNGDITARSSSGSITARELRSASIAVATTSGRISLDLVEPGDVRATASSGSITVTVPGGSYRVDTKVTSGRTRLGVTNDPAGRYHLDLRTTSGSITVAHR